MRQLLCVAVVDKQQRFVGGVLGEEGEGGGGFMWWFE